MATATKTKSGNWKAIARCFADGKYYFHKTRTFDTKREALAWAEEAEERAKQARRDGRIQPTQITLCEAIEVYEEDIEQYINTASSETRKSAEFTAFTKRTEKNKTRRRAWKESFLAERVFASIEQTDIEQFIDNRRDDERSESTIRNDLAALDHLYDHAAAATRPAQPTGWQWAIENPIKAASKARRLASSRQRERRLAPAEIEQIRRILAKLRAAQLAAPASEKRTFIEIEISNSDTLRFESDNSLLYIAAAFDLAIETALRKTKLFSITWRWIDLSTNNERIIVPPNERGPANKNAPAYLPLSPRAVEIIKKLKKQQANIDIDAPIFDCLRADRAWRILYIVCNALKIEDFTWHDLRHEACSRLAERGWTIFEIQAVSGHKSLASLQRYVHVNKRSIYEKMRAAA